MKSLNIKIQRNIHDEPSVNVNGYGIFGSLTGRRGRARFVLSISCWLFGALAPLAAVANPPDSTPSTWVTVTAENNNFGGNQDYNYVNGFNASVLSPIAPQGGSLFHQNARSIFDHWTWLFASRGAKDRRFEWTVIGQQIYTPANKDLSVPDPNDRPYAAWLYTGLDLLQDSDANRLDDLFITLGVVGPAALGRQVQTGFHKVLGFGDVHGWNYQLKNEPALTLGYARKWRLGTTMPDFHGLEMDLVPELGATLGNVMTQAEATMLARIGWGLNTSYGPRLLSPGLEGDGYYAPERGAQRGGFYLFVGEQVRAVGRNIFLDGNTFRSGPSVAKYPCVHAFVGGLSAVVWREIRIDMTFVHVSDEFKKQLESESYGSVTVSAQW